MSNKEQFNQAFSQIDDKLIEQAATAPKNQKVLWKRWGSLAVAISILICISIGAFHAKRQTHSSNVSKNGWETVYSGESSLKKTKTGINGFQYMLCIGYAPVETIYKNILSINPRDDIFSEMFGQWLVSQLAFDYEQHFALFDEEYLNKTLYRVFEKGGLTVAEANQKIAQIAADVVGFTDYRVEYTILDIKNTPELLQEYKDEYRTRFQKAELDVNRIEEVCEYTFEEVNIYFNDIFVNRSYISGIIFYKYNGEWYISPDMLEDDISLDLLQSDKESGEGYYELNSIFGQVEKIENGYAVLYSTDYFLIKDADINVGDFVRITYYNMGLDAVRVSDGERCNINVIAKVEKMTDMDNSVK